MSKTFPPPAKQTRPFRVPAVSLHRGPVRPQGVEQIRFVPEPPDPAVNTAVEWYSDGTGYGDAGDKITKINVAGTIKTFTWPDFSEITDEDP